MGILDEGLVGRLLWSAAGLFFRGGGGTQNGDVFGRNMFFLFFDLLELVCMICSLMGLLSCFIKPFVDRRMLGVLQV